MKYHQLSRSNKFFFLENLPDYQLVRVVNDLERSLEHVHLQDCDSEKEEIRQPVAVAQSTPVPVIRAQQLDSFRLS